MAQKTKAVSRTAFDFTFLKRIKELVYFGQEVLQPLF